jgi:hypothetical protein
MRLPRARSESASKRARSHGVGIRSAAACALALAAAAMCVGCDAEPKSIDERTPRDGHLWDTEDPDAAGAPREVLFAAGAFVATLAVALVVARSRRSSRGAGTTSRVRVRGRRISVSVARRVRIFDGDGAKSRGHRAGQGRPAGTEFPGFMSEQGLLETIERIANDPTAYRSGALPTIPGRFLAAARVRGRHGEAVLLKVVVEPAGEGVLAAYPGDGPRTAGEAAFGESDAAAPRDVVREALARACAALPDAAAAYAEVSPLHPDSIGTLACFEELMRQNEPETALYALDEIARDVGAPSACRAALDDAATALDVRRW